MFQSIADFFNSDDFMPHGHCFLWQPGILWLHVLSDAGIVFAYYALPVALIYLIRKRKDLPFQKVFWLFGAFILLCGTTHLLAIWVLWHPDYAIEGVIKAATAVASLATLAVLIKLLPEALKLVNPGARALADSEMRLRAVVDNTAEGMITIDEHGIVQTFNKACERIFGYSPDEVFGKNIKMLMPEPTRGEHDGYIDRYKKTGEGRIIGTVGREVEGLKKDGTLFSLELSISVISVGGNRIFSGILRDVTERKQAAQRMEQLIAELTESNTQLERFAYICSHDLQEPLRMISNYTERLGKHLGDSLDEKGKHYMKYVTDGADNARALIADVLTYARIGNETEKPEAVDCNEVLEKILVMLEPAIQDSHAVVTYDRLPTISGHATQILQLFQNLLTNAIKFRNKDVPRVHIGAWKEGDMWEFSVSDNGISIAPEYRERVFIIFQRLNKRGEYPGTGIGLAICKKIVERQGGRIRLESELGKGTTFFFTLPAFIHNQEYDHEL